MKKSLTRIIVLLIVFGCQQQVDCLDNEFQELIKNIDKEELHNFSVLDLSIKDENYIKSIKSINEYVLEFVSLNENKLHLSTHLDTLGFNDNNHYRIHYLTFCLYKYLNNKEYCNLETLELLKYHISFLNDLKNEEIYEENRLLGIKKYNEISIGDTVDFKFSFVPNRSSERKYVQKYIDNSRHIDCSFVLQGEVLNKFFGEKDSTNATLEVKVFMVSEPSIIFNYPDSLKVNDTIKIDINRLLI